MGKWKTPFKSLLPSLSREERQALKDDIKSVSGKVLQPIIVDEEGNILDGHNRYAIDKDAPYVKREGLTDAQKKAFVFRMNFNRRNLSPPQKKEAMKTAKLIAKELREEDHRLWTLPRIGKELGIDKSTVSRWFGDMTKLQSQLSHVLDARLKLPPSAKQDIADRVAAGETQKDVADDYKINPSTVSKIVKDETKKAETKKKRAAAAKRRKHNNGVILGDFRKGGDEPESFDLIFTDPPYDAKSASLYKDLAEYASKTLVKGGWILAYSGQQHLPEVYEAFSTNGLTYAWTFCVVHSGGDLRFRKYKLYNGWKPIIAAYKPPLQVDWDWFGDVVSGGKEKDDHPWQQAESESAHFIERLCPVKGIVCDPFCGSGTTLVAAKSLKRRWHGYEIDENHVESARGRLDD